MNYVGNESLFSLYPDKYQEVSYYFEAETGILWLYGNEARLLSEKDDEYMCPIEKIDLDLERIFVIQCTEDCGRIEIQNANRLFYRLSNCETIDFSHLDFSKNRVFEQTFDGCKSLTSLDLSGWVTGSIKNMGYMFSDCESLTSLNLTGLNTRLTTNLNGTFSGCKSLTSLDLSSWDTHSVTNMYGTFRECLSLTSLNLTGWDTSSVVYMNYAFYRCESLTSLNLSSWDTQNVSQMTGMFEECSVLKTLDLTNFTIASYVKVDDMLLGCNQLMSVKLPASVNVTIPFSWHPYYQAYDVNNELVDGTYYANLICATDTICYLKTSTSRLVCDYTDKVLTITGEGLFLNSVLDSYKNEIQRLIFNSESKLIGVPYDCTNMFAFLPTLTTLDLSGLNTSHVNNMCSMFHGDRSLTNINLTGFDTTNVTNMSNMFYYCKSLTSLDLSSFDTSNVTDMYKMLFGCSSLTNLDLSSFNTTNVTDLSRMFQACTSLTTLDLSGWNVEKVEEAYYAISGCSSLRNLNLSRWNLKNLWQGSSMLTSYSYEGWFNEIESKLADWYYVPEELITDDFDLQGTITEESMSIQEYITQVLGATKEPQCIYFDSLYTPTSCAIDIDLPNVMYDVNNTENYETISSEWTESKLLKSIIVKYYDDSDKTNQLGWEFVEYNNDTIQYPTESGNNTWFDCETQQQTSLLRLTQSVDVCLTRLQQMGRKIIVGLANLTRLILGQSVVSKVYLGQKLCYSKETGLVDKTYGGLSAFTYAELANYTYGELSSAE